MTDETETTPNVGIERDEPTDKLQRELCERINAPLGGNARVVFVLDVSEGKNGRGDATGSSSLLFDEGKVDIGALVVGRSLRRMIGAVARGFDGPSREEIVGAIMLKMGKVAEQTLKDSVRFAKDDGDQEDTEEDAAEEEQE